jgi:hypothetical protein
MRPSAAGRQQEIPTAGGALMRGSKLLTMAAVALAVVLGVEVYKSRRG